MAQTQTRQQEQPQAAPAQRQEVAAPPQERSVAAVFAGDLDDYTPNLKDALPPEIPVARFKRILVTAVSMNPELLYADRRSLFNSATKCAVDGLLPDGREAALVVFNTEVKRRDRETGIDRIVKVAMVQYLPMVQGLRKRMRLSGEVISAVAEAVFEKDHFRYRLGDDGAIEHVPPPLGTNRGQVIGAYAIIRLRSGEVIRDVIDRPTIEAARNVSRAKNSPMWTNFYWEGAKKTVLRRASKQAPFSSELRQLVERDDEIEDVTRLAPDFAPGVRDEPEPRREDYRIARDPNPGPEYPVVDLDGVENIYASPGAAAEALRVLMDEAARLGPRRLEGWWEGNEGALQLIAVAGYGEAAIELTRAYEDMRKRLSQADAPPTATEPARARRTRATPAPANEPPQSEPANDAPAQAGDDAGEAAGNEDERGDQEEIDHRMPPTDDAPPVDERRSQAIAMPVKSGKPDYRTWAIALLATKVRRCTTSEELAFLLGDNEDNLAKARAAMLPADCHELAAVIDEQWKKLP